MEFEKLVSLMRICRGCLDNKRKMVNTALFKDAFRDLIGITISQTDGLPQVLCQECADLLRKYTRFRKKVISSHQQLLKFVKNGKPDEQQGDKDVGNSEKTLEITTENVADEERTEQSDYEEEWCEEFYSNDLTSESTTLDPKTGLQEASDEHGRAAKEPERLSVQWRHLMDHDYILLPREDNEDTKTKNNTDKKHKITYKYKCKVCYERFNNKIILMKHSRKHTATQFMCLECKKCFRSEGYVLRHMRVHRYYKPYKCNICLKSFKCETNFHKHKCVFIGIKPYKCDICLKSFKTKMNLNKHVFVHSGIKPRRCDYCLKSFNTKEDLAMHVRVHFSDKPYNCDICNKCYKQNSHLRRHYRTHTNERPYQCEVCSKTFIDKFRFDIHARGHTAVKPYSCDVCKHSFTQKTHLNVHFRIHTGVKPYKCICMKRFNDKSSYMRHVRKYCRARQ